MAGALLSDMSLWERGWGFPVKKKRMGLVESIKNWGRFSGRTRLIKGGMSILGTSARRGVRR